METLHIRLVDEGDGHTIAIGTGGTSYAMHVILSIVGHVVVDDNADIVDVDASGHDIGSHQHIGHACLETIHHLVALLLREVGVHLTTVDVHLLQTAGDIFYSLLLTREDDDALQVARLEDVVDDLELLRVVAHVGTLLNLFGWARNGYLDLYRIVEQGNSQLTDLGRHGG